LADTTDLGKLFHVFTTLLVQEFSSSWDGPPFGHNRHAPFGGAGSPSNTMLPEPRPTSLPSGILIHPAVWPQ